MDHSGSEPEDGEILDESETLDLDKGISPGEYYGRAVKKKHSTSHDRFRSTRRSNKGSTTESNYQSTTKYGSHSQFSLYRSLSLENRRPFPFHRSQERLKDAHRRNTRRSFDRSSRPSFDTFENSNGRYRPSSSKGSTDGRRRVVIESKQSPVSSIFENETGILMKRPSPINEVSRHSKSKQDKKNGYTSERNQVDSRPRQGKDGRSKEANKVPELTSKTQQIPIPTIPDSSSEVQSQAKATPQESSTVKRSELVEGGEDISDDDSSVVIVPFSRKSPEIITLDATDTSEDEIQDTFAEISPEVSCITRRSLEDGADTKQVVSNAEPSSINDGSSIQQTGLDTDHTSVVSNDTGSNEAVAKTVEEISELPPNATTKPKERRSLDNEDLHILELRNTLLASMVEKMNNQPDDATELSTPNVAPDPIEADSGSEEETILREVLISQMVNKAKAKTQRIKPKVDPSPVQQANSSDIPLTPASPSPPPTTSSSSKSNNASTRPTIVIFDNDPPQKSSSSSSRGTSCNENSPTFESVTSRRSRRRSRRTNRIGKDTSQEACNSSNQKTMAEQEVHRVVRVTDEPLLSPMSTSSSPRNLPVNDLRRKLLRNGRGSKTNTEQSNPATCHANNSYFEFREFGVVDTDLRADVGRTQDPAISADDIMIRRTVNFDRDNSSAATSSNLTVTQPISVDIPAGGGPFSNYAEQSLPQFYSGFRPATTTHAVFSPTPVSPLMHNPQGFQRFPLAPMGARPNFPFASPSLVGMGAPYVHESRNFGGLRSPPPAYFDHSPGTGGLDVDHRRNIPHLGNGMPLHPQQNPAFLLPRNSFGSEGGDHMNLPQFSPHHLYPTPNLSGFTASGMPPVNTQPIVSSSSNFGAGMISTGAYGTSTNDDLTFGDLDRANITSDYLARVEQLDAQYNLNDTMDDVPTTAVHIEILVEPPDVDTSEFEEAGAWIATTIAEPPISASCPVCCSKVEPSTTRNGNLYVSSLSRISSAPSAAGPSNVQVSSSGMQAPIVSASEQQGYRSGVKQEPRVTPPQNQSIRKTTSSDVKPYAAEKGDNQPTTSKDKNNQEKNASTKLKRASEIKTTSSPIPCNTSQPKQTKLSPVSEMGSSFANIAIQPSPVTAEVSSKPVKVTQSKTTSQPVSNNGQALPVRTESSSATSTPTKTFSRAVASTSSSSKVFLGQKQGATLKKTSTPSPLAKTTFTPSLQQNISRLTTPTLSPHSSGHKRNLSPHWHSGHTKIQRLVIHVRDDDTSTSEEESPDVEMETSWSPTVGPVFKQSLDAFLKKAREASGSRAGLANESARNNEAVDSGENTTSDSGTGKPSITSGEPSNQIIRTNQIVATPNSRAKETSPGKVIKNDVTPTRGSTKDMEPKQGKVATPKSSQVPTSDPKPVDVMKHPGNGQKMATEASGKGGPLKLQSQSPVNGPTLFLRTSGIAAKLTAASPQSHEPRTVNGPALKGATLGQSQVNVPTLYLRTSDIAPKLPATSPQSHEPRTVNGPARKGATLGQPPANGPTLFLRTSDIMAKLPAASTQSHKPQTANGPARKEATLEKTASLPNLVTESISTSTATTLSSTGTSSNLNSQKPVSTNNEASALGSPNDALDPIVNSPAAPLDSSATKDSNEKDTASQAYIDDLAKKITESRDQLALSGKQKRLINTRQKCLNDLRGIKTNMEQHVHFVNLESNCQNEINQLERKLITLRSRRDILHDKAVEINYTITKKAEKILPERARCIKLARDVSKLGLAVIGDRYRPPEIFTREISDVVKALERLDSSQPQSFQKQRGVEFQKLLGKKTDQNVNKSTQFIINKSTPSAAKISLAGAPSRIQPTTAIRTAANSSASTSISKSASASASTSMSKSVSAPTPVSKSASAPTPVSKSASAPTPVSKSASAPTAASKSASAPTTASKSASAPTTASKSTPASTYVLQTESTSASILASISRATSASTVTNAPEAKNNQNLGKLFLTKSGYQANAEYPDEDRNMERSPFLAPRGPDGRPIEVKMTMTLDPDLSLECLNQSGRARIADPVLQICPDHLQGVACARDQCKFQHL